MPILKIEILQCRICTLLIRRNSLKIAGNWLHNLTFFNTRRADVWHTSGLLVLKNDQIVLQDCQQFSHAFWRKIIQQQTNIVLGGSFLSDQNSQITLFWNFYVCFAFSLRSPAGGQHPQYRCEGPWKLRDERDRAGGRHGEGRWRRWLYPTSSILKSMFIHRSYSNFVASSFAVQFDKMSSMFLPAYIETTR